MRRQELGSPVTQHVVCSDGANRQPAESRRPLAAESVSAHDHNGDRHAGQSPVLGGTRAIASALALSKAVNPRGRSSKAVGYLKGTVADSNFRKPFPFQHLRNRIARESLRRELCKGRAKTGHTPRPHRDLLANRNDVCEPRVSCRQRSRPAGLVENPAGRLPHGRRPNWSILCPPQRYRPDH